MESVCFAPFFFAVLLSISDTTSVRPEMNAVPPTDKVAKRGSNVTLKCVGRKVDPTIDTTIKWTFNGRSIEEHTNKKARQHLKDSREGDFYLDITNVSEKDVGKYVCSAETSQYPANGSINLTLYNKVLNVSSTRQNINVSEGSSITLQCNVSFTEADDVWTFWLLNGRPMETMLLEKASGDKTLTNTVKNRSFSWPLKYVRLAQSGIYTCGANSTTIMSAQNISVSVHDVPGPRLEQSESTVQIMNGKNRTISCTAVYPDASYVDTFWLFNGSRIQTNSKYDVPDAWPVRNDETNRKRISLKIYNAEITDSGQYACVLNTSHGWSLQNFSVRVIPDSNGKDSEPFPTDKLSLTRTMLFIVLGLFVGLITMAVLIKFWIGRRHKPPASLRLPPDIDENDFKFDVFVTYSRKDCHWVDKELLCLLRENQVKYCVDHEHFELGKVFVQAMVDSVYQSRKVLAVWSENYASSKYCKQELDYAIQRSFRNNDCSVIVIRLDRTGRKRLPKPLRAKTFLDYSDSVERKGWEKRLITHLKGSDHKNNATATIV